MMTVQQLAAEADCCERTIYRAIKSGKLMALRDETGRLFFREHEAREWILQRFEPKPRGELTPVEPDYD